MEKKSGIYVITCTVNDKVHIGSSKDTDARWICRRQTLKRNKGSL